MLALAFLLTTAAAIGSPTSLLCSVEINPFAVPPRDSYFWATFTDRLAFAGTLSSYGIPLSDAWGMSDSTEAVWGQVVRIGGFGGEGRRWFGSGNTSVEPRTAIVVFWSYDAGCEPVLLPGKEAWGIPGVTAFFRATPRSKNLWVDGLPTFDAFWAGQTVYPFEATVQGAESQQWARRESLVRASPADSSVLGAIEAFNLLSSLPATCDYIRDSALATSRLASVQRQWQHRSSDPVVQQILGFHASLSKGGNRYLKEACSGSRQMLSGPQSAS